MTARTRKKPLPLSAATPPAAAGSAPLHIQIRESIRRQVPQISEHRRGEMQCRRLSEPHRLESGTRRGPQARQSGPSALEQLTEFVKGVRANYKPRKKK